MKRWKKAVPSSTSWFPTPSDPITLGWKIREGIMRSAIQAYSTAVLSLLALAGTATNAPAASLSVIYSFCQKTNCADGDQPYGGVMQDASRRLLRTTGLGGKHNGG